MNHSGLSAPVNRHQLVKVHGATHHITAERGGRGKRQSHARAMSV